MRSATRSPRICCAMAETCARCRSCSVTPRYRRRKNTPKSKAPAFWPSTTPRIRAPAPGDRRPPLMTIEPDVAAPPVNGLKRALPLGYAFAAMGALLFSTKAIIVKIAYDYDVHPDTLI